MHSAGRVGAARLTRGWGRGAGAGCRVQRGYSPTPGQLHGHPTAQGVCPGHLLLLRWFAWRRGACALFWQQCFYLHVLKSQHITRVLCLSIWLPLWKIAFCPWLLLYSFGSIQKRNVGHFCSVRVVVKLAQLMLFALHVTASNTSLPGLLLIQHPYL